MCVIVQNFVKISKTVLEIAIFCSLSTSSLSAAILDFQIFGHWSILGGKSALSCKITSKPVKRLQMYLHFMFFKRHMFAILNFLIILIAEQLGSNGELIRVITRNFV